MKKILVVFSVLLISIFLFSACGCAHENWTSSENGEKICADCETLYCEINGHIWYAATCEEPKRCENCVLTEGEALGHSWVDATCEKSKYCSVCNMIEGEALGHSWLEATTEAPKTCETCAKTEGERIITDERFKTANCSMLFGKWEGIYNLSGNDYQPGFSKYIKEFPCVYVLEFSNDGKLSVSATPEKVEGFVTALQNYTRDSFYAEFAAAGFGSDEVDAYILETFGMTTKEYIASEIAKINIDEIFEAYFYEFCYYVDGNQIYLGNSWEEMDDFVYFYIEDGILYYPINGEETPFTRTE